MMDIIKRYLKISKPYLGLAGFVLLVAIALAYLIMGFMNIWLWVALAAGAVPFGAGIYFYHHELWAWVSRRSLRTGAHILLQVVIILGIVIILMAISFQHRVQWDLTKNQRFSLSDKTQSVLQALTHPVKATAFFQRGQEGEMRDLLKLYAKRSPKFTYEFVDPDRNPGLAKSYAITQYRTTVFECGKKTEKITETKEENVTNSVVKVTREQTKRLYFIKGHGENDPASIQPLGYKTIADGLTAEGYEVQDLFLAQQKTIPEDAAAVLLSGPKTDLFQNELVLLGAYLKRGGHLLVQVDPNTRVSGLIRWLRNYGVHVSNNVIVDPVSRVFGADVLIPLVTQYENHAITRDFRLTTFYPLACSLDLAENFPAGTVGQAIARTGPQSWSKPDFSMIKQGKVDFNPSRDRKGPLTVVAVLTIDAEGTVKGVEAGNAPRLKSQMVVMGNSALGQNNYVGIAGNKDFLMNIINFLAEEADLIAIAPRQPEFQPIMLTAWQGRLFVWWPVAIVPVLILTFGAVSLWLRRRIYQ